MLEELKERREKLVQTSQALTSQAQRIQQEMLATRGRILEVDRIIGELEKAQVGQEGTELEAVGE